ARRQQHLRIHRPPLGWPDDPSGRRGLPEYSDVVQLARANLDISLTQPAGLLRVARESLSRLVRSLINLGPQGQRPCTKFDPEPVFKAASVQLLLAIDLTGPVSLWVETLAAWVTDLGMDRSCFWPDDPTE